MSLGINRAAHELAVAYIVAGEMPWALDHEAVQSSAGQVGEAMRAYSVHREEGTIDIGH